MQVNYDIAIVGYGPVGQVLASLLGKAGYRVGVFERQDGLYPLPRIGHLDHEVMRIIQAVGDVDRFEKLSVAVPTYEWVNQHGDVLINMDWSTPEPTGWQPHYFFYQPELERVLADSVECQSNIEVHRLWEAVDLVQNAETVTLEIKPRSSGKTRRITAKYLIGADGANSFVRNRLGLEWEDLGFRAAWLVVDYRPNDPEARIDIPLAAQLCDPARPVSMFRRIGHHHCRWEFMLLPGETREEIERPERIWELLSRWVSPADGTLIRHAVYTFRSCLAPEWRQGRVILAGDSAHHMPPFLGQGMGSGLRDAINLAWKLDLVMKRAAPPSLLDTYMEERKPHVRAIIEQAVELGKVVCVSDPELAATRDAELLSGHAPAPPPFPDLQGRLFLSDGGRKGLLSGRQSPQAKIEFMGRLGRADDILGHGWTIVVSDAALARAVKENFEVSLKQLKATVVSFSADAGADIQDLDGTYQSFFREHGIVALVIRPDFQIYGAAKNPSSAVLLMDSLANAVLETLAIAA